MSKYAKIINDLITPQNVIDTNFIYACDLSDEGPSQSYLHRSSILNIELMWDYDKENLDSDPYSIEIQIDLPNNMRIWCFTEDSKHLSPMQFLGYIEDTLCFLLNKPQLNNNDVDTLYYYRK